MKAIPQGYGGLRIEAENDADKVWLEGWVNNFIGHKSRQKALGEIAYFDLEDGNVRDDNTPAKECKLSEIMSEEKGDGKGHIWAMVEAIEFSAFGH